MRSIGPKIDSITRPAVIGHEGNPVRFVPEGNGHMVELIRGSFLSNGKFPSLTRVTKVMHTERRAIIP
jgi:hypothetical protein